MQNNRKNHRKLEYIIHSRRVVQIFAFRTPAPESDIFQKKNWYFTHIPAIKILGRMLNVHGGWARVKGRPVNLKVEHPWRYLERESHANELCAN